MSSAKKTMDYLIGIEKELNQFDGLELTKENREKLYKLIKLQTEIATFSRKDDTTKKLVQLWWGEAANHGMSPDVVIGIDDKNHVWVNTDILWKTITGYHEIVQEERTYNGF